MAEETPRVFTMDTVVSLLAGKSGGSVSDLMAFMTDRELSASEEELVRPLCAAWLCKQNPAFMDVAYDEAAPFSEFVKSASKALGADNVSIPAIPTAEMSPIAGVIDTLRAKADEVVELAAKIEELEAQVEELSPYKPKAESLEKKVESLEEQIKTLQTEKAGLATELKEFDGKLPVDETGLNKTIADLVTKAIKDAAASVVVAGGAAPGEAAAAEETPSEEAGVPDDFGFGASGSDGDGFGF